MMLIEFFNFTQITNSCDIYNVIYDILDKIILIVLNKNIFYIK